MKEAIIQGSFADIKTVKSRSVVQIIVEAPIEEGEEIVRKLGFPQPGKEIPLALAALRPDRANNNTKSAEKSKAQEAGILCNDQRFQRWMGADNANTAAIMVRERLDIQSRKDLNEDTDAAAAWDALVVQYKQDNGLMAVG